MRKSGLTGDEAYILSKHGKTTEDLGPLKKEIGLIKEDLGNLSSSKISKFYATNNGENHLADSDDGKIADMMVYGKSEQKSTMGKNLLKLSEANAQGNAQGLSATMNADGSISVTGASTSTWSNIIKINNECHTDNATYTFSVDKNSGIIIGLKLWRTELDDANYQTHRIMQNQLSCTFETGASNEYCSLFLEGLTVGKSYNFTIYPMLELGTEATAYEPYTGGQPSPSQDYPQEIKSVVNPIVKVYGKNMMPYPKDNTVRMNGVTLTVKDGKYTLVGKPTTNTWLNIYPRVLDSTASDMLSEKPLPTKGKKISMINGGTGYSLNFRKVSNGDKVFGIEYNDAKLADEDSNGVFLHIYKTDKTYNDTFEIMISDPADTTSTVFEPYTEQEVSLPYTLNAIPVNSGGNVTIDGQQYVADYVDVERGKLAKMVDSSKLDNAQSIVNKTEWLLAEPQEIDLTQEEVQTLKALATYYPTTNISVNSEQLDGYTVFNYPISMQNGWNYVKQQLNDNRDYIYDMDTKTQDIDTQAAEAYVNSEYAVALTELEV